MARHHLATPALDGAYEHCLSELRELDRDGGLASEATEGFFTAGTNNNSAFTATLTNLFVNGANETAVPAFDASTLSSFFDATTYIGAVRDASDTWYQGWTCNSATLNFGTDNTGLCTSLPVYS